MADDRYTRAFDAAGSDFDRLGTHLWKPIGRATVDRTSPTDGQRVLDACCGNGASAIPAAERVGETGQVDAVDLSAVLIRELDRSAAGLPQLHPHVADVTSWPYGGYDVVQAVLGVFFFPDMAAGTEHLIGRARPGGRVGITTWRRGAMEAAGVHLEAAVNKVNGTTPAPRRPSLLDRVNESAVFRSWLTERGLIDVTVTTHELQLPVTPELAWLVVTGSGFVAALAGMDEAKTDAVRDTYLDSLSRDGIAEFDATTLIAVGTR